MLQREARTDPVSSTVPINDHDTRFSRLRDGGNCWETRVEWMGENSAESQRPRVKKALGGRSLGTGVLWLAWVPQEDRASDEYPPRIDEYHCIGPQYVYVSYPRTLPHDQPVAIE